MGEARLFYDPHHDMHLTDQLNEGRRPVSHGLLDRPAGRARELCVRIRILAMEHTGDGGTGPKADPDDICSLESLDLCIAGAENWLRSRRVAPSELVAAAGDEDPGCAVLPGPRQGIARPRAHRRFG